MAGYRLATYRAAEGARAGIVVDGVVYDAAELTGKAEYASTLDILRDWTAAQAALEGAASSAAKASSSGTPLKMAHLLAPALYPSAVFCAGANYADHVAEMARVQNLRPDPDPHTLGLPPWHFIKASRAIVGPQAIVALPAYSKMVDWEAELTAVIGKPAKNVSLDEALSHVAGYTVANDLSARDFIKRPGVADASPFKYDWTSQKSFDGACPLGPWIVPAKEIPDPQKLGIKLWVNDVLKQDSNTSRMIFTVAEQIAHLSTRITLHPGDLVVTGTPAGVGLARNEFLRPGDVVRVWIERVGVLINTME